MAAAELLSLILLLAGAFPNVGVLDTVLSAAAPALCLGAFTVLFRQLRSSVWAVLALLFMVVNTTMTLTGDALQHVVFHSPITGLDKGGLWVVTMAIRDTVGNNFFYVALALVGWLDMALSQTNQPGLPPHTNFLLIVVWLVVLGASTLKRETAAEITYQPAFAA